MNRPRDTPTRAFLFPNFIQFTVPYRIPVSINEKSLQIKVDPCCAKPNVSSTVTEFGDRLATIDMGQVGLMCPFLWGAGSPSSTMSPRPRSTSVPNSILIHPAVWPQTRAKNWGMLCFLGGEVGCWFSSDTVRPGPRPIPPCQMAS